MQAFLAKLAEEYPVLLTAEILVLLTIAALTFFSRRLLVPIAERYSRSYREYRIKLITKHLRYIDHLLSNEQQRIRRLVYDSALFLFYTIALVAFIVLDLMLSISAPLHLIDLPEEWRALLKLGLSQGCLLAGVGSSILGLHKNSQIRIIADAETTRLRLAASLATLRTDTR
jgi:hypothetical protein